MKTSSLDFFNAVVICLSALLASAILRTRWFSLNRRTNFSVQLFQGLKCCLKKLPWRVGTNHTGKTYNDVRRLERTKTHSEEQHNPRLTAISARSWAKDKGARVHVTQFRLSQRGAKRTLCTHTANRDVPRVEVGVQWTVCVRVEASPRPTRQKRMGTK